MVPCQFILSTAMMILFIHMLPCFSFIGPTGVQMVVNCLPLYQPPDEAAQASAGSNHSPSHNIGSSKLIKARSMESISSSQLGDDEGQYDPKTVGEVATPPRRKSSKFNHYSVTAHSVPVSQPAASNGTEIHEDKQQSTDDDNSGAKSQAGEASQSSAETTENADKAKDSDGKKSDDGISSGGETAAVGSSDGVVQAENSESTNTEKGKENLTNESEEAKKEEQETDLVSDGASADGKTEPTEAENKLETSEEVKSKPEVNDSEAEQHKHTRLQKTRSERASLSPDGDLSDSEDNGFSVNYIQDPFVVPQLKRSSGSVSFYAPNIPTVAASEAMAISSTHNVRDETLLEMSAENKLDSASSEKSEEDSAATDGGKSDGASGEGEPTSREKSLSTAKPLILVETNTLLQQSATGGGPTAPAQTSPSPTTSSPPSSPEAKTQAPPTSNGQLAIRATPLPGPPVTFDQDYTERSGWLNKLSHRKGMFGDKWQKRYFVLHRSWLYYFKKYGVRM